MLGLFFCSFVCSRVRSVLRPLVWNGNLERHSTYYEGEERPDSHGSIEVPTEAGEDGGGLVSWLGIEPRTAPFQGVLLPTELPV